MTLNYYLGQLEQEARAIHFVHIAIIIHLLGKYIQSINFNLTNSTHI